MNDWLYPAAALPLLAAALRCFARSARGRAPGPAVGWFLLGVVLGALGLDSVRLILALTGASASPVAFLPVTLIGGCLFYVSLRVWRELGERTPAERLAARAAAQVAELEALAGGAPKVDSAGSDPPTEVVS